MGHGYWKRERFEEYSSSVGRTVAKDGSISGNYSNQEMFRMRNLHPLLDPKNVIRECCDTEEHPNTIPVILALDVTGSMGQAAVEVAKKLNLIMTELYDKVEDVEFMIMGIGDLTYDKAPIQISQFESDIRIAEQLDKLYFEFGGGGNQFESYTAAWYMASRHTRLDCWKRGKKGILITMGDERLNPYLPLKGNYCGLAAAMSMGDAELTDCLKKIRDEYLPNRLRELGVHTISREWEDIIGDEGLIQKFLQDFRFMCSKMELIQDDVLKEYDAIVFENGQGLLLDQNIKEFNEHTTPSNTGLQNPGEIICKVFEKEAVDVEICYVTRTYLTRHGAGPLPTECEKKEINPNMTDRTNVPNPHQGTLRYGWLEGEALEKRIREDFSNQNGWKLSLAITHTNEYDVLPAVTFAKKYLSDGESRESVRKTT